jgi:hypothetical protein
MDRELEEAQELTRDDLIAKLRTGRPANLARRLQGNPKAAPVGGFGLSVGFSEVTIENLHFVNDVITVADSSGVKILA